MRVYVVSQGWAYEGESANWAGLDFDAAMTFADTVQYAEFVSVVAHDPEPVEYWRRHGSYIEGPATFTYLHGRPLPDGRSHEQLQSVEREVG